MNGSATSVLSSQQQGFQPTNITSVVQSIGSAGVGSGDDKDQSQSTSTQHESGPTMLGQMISQAKAPSNSITPLVTMCCNTETPAATTTPVDVPSVSLPEEAPLIDSSAGEHTDKTLPLMPTAQCDEASTEAETTVTVIEPPIIVSEESSSAPATTDSVNNSSSESSSESTTSDETEPATFSTIDNATVASTSQPELKEDEQKESNATQQTEEKVNPPDAANIVIEEERRISDVVLPMKVGDNYDLSIFFYFYLYIQGHLKV